MTLVLAALILPNCFPGCLFHGRLPQGTAWMKDRMCEDGVAEQVPPC